MGYDRIFGYYIIILIIMRGEIILKNFVNYEWLMENINKEQLIILDVRKGEEPLEGIALYKEGHIKGAQYVQEEIFVGEVTKHGGRSPLPNLDEFVENMKSLGINNDSTVVIYDEEDMSTAGRLWWILKHIGKDKVYVLNGGYNKWKYSNGEITSEIPKVEKSDSLSLCIDKNLEVDMEYVKKAINKDYTAIIDSRAYERYIGEVEPLDRIPGHIPNAINYPWTKVVEDGEIMSLEKAKEYFKDLFDYEEIIIYCGSGITATVNIMLMEEIGLKPKHYSGGYSDWVSYLDNEVIVG